MVGKQEQCPGKQLQAAASQASNPTPWLAVMSSNQARNHQQRPAGNNSLACITHSVGLYGERVYIIDLSRL